MSVIRYIFEVIICSGILMVTYRWLISGKVRFCLCRGFILASMLLSVVIPALEIPVYRSSSSETFYSDFLYETYHSFQEDNNVIFLSEQTYDLLNSSEDVQAEMLPSVKMLDIKSVTGVIFIIVYITVALVSLGLTIYGAAKIGRLKKKSRLTYTPNYTLAEHEETKTPFSFLRTIFIGLDYEVYEREQIIAHEASHIRHRHSYERLALSLLRSVFWFNPFFWMAGGALEEVQEWEADKDVLGMGYELNVYRTTIFKQLFGYNPDISCGLNHSLTKQRFIMMTQSRSGKGAWIRLAATLPIITAVFLAFGCGSRSPQQTVGTEEETNLTDTFDIQRTLIVNIKKEDGDQFSYYVIEGQRYEYQNVKGAITDKIAADSLIRTIQINAESDIRMGAVTDLKELLRDIPDLKIVYTLGTTSLIPPPAPDVKEEYIPSQNLTVMNYGTPRNNIIVMKTNAQDRYLIGARPDYLTDETADRVKGYILNEERDNDCPDLVEKEIALPDGRVITYPVTQAMILMQNDRGTSYKGYMDINLFVENIYSDLRDKLAMELFDRPLELLSKAETQAISEAIPMRVYEDEPKTVRYLTLDKK